MESVVSLGSVNVDRMYFVSDSEITECRARYDWFPDRGQTVQIDEPPTGFPADAESVRHGGKGANQAVAAATAGAETTMLGRVGPDQEEFGVLDRLTERGVSVDRVGMSSEPTGTADVFVGPEGDSWIVVQPGANGTVDSAYIREQYDAILSAGCLLLQNEIPTEPVATLLSRLATERDRPTVVLDPAPADGVEELLRCDAVDYLTPNRSEYRALQPSIGEFDGVVVHKQGADKVILEAEQRTV
jgi:Sugar kinases, ribokinase family